MQDRLIEAFYRTAMTSPDKIALVTERSQMSYKDVLSLTQVLDIQLKTRGVREGQTIVVDTDRGELSIAFAMLLSLRSLNIVFSSAQLAKSRGIEFDRIVASAPVDTVAPDKQIVMEADWFSLMGTVPVPRYENLSGEGGSFITQTSGTTGTPKFVHSPEASRMHDMMAMSTISPDKMPAVRFMTTASSNTGWAMNKNLPVLLGGGSVLSLGQDASRVLPFADLWRASHLSVTPFVLQQALKIKAAAQYLTSVEEIEIAGAFAPRDLLKAISEVCPAALVTAYGATEVGALCRRVYTADAINGDGYLGEVFRTDLELAFMDDQLNEMPGASEGILAMRLPANAPRSYLVPDPETDGIGLKGDLFVSGDIVRRDGDSLYLTGRTKRILNLNGDKYPLDGIQAVLAHELPEGSQVATIAAVDQDGLEQLVVFHTGAGEIPTTGLEAILRKHWRNLTVGESHCLPDMPMTPSGKIDLGALRDLIPKDRRK